MFRRRTTETAPPPPEETPDPKTGGKGRPTPKRREAEQARKDRVRPPRDRREAAQQQRARAKEQRAKVQQALATGDDRYLPERDKGPKKRFVRDFVDARRTLAEYLLPFFLVIFVLMMFKNQPLLVNVATLLWLIAIVAAPLDLFLLSRRLKKAMQAKFPNESLKGCTAYGLMRATQIRKLRLPKPQVKPGEKVA